MSTTAKDIDEKRVLSAITANTTTDLNGDFIELHLILEDQLTWPND